MPLIAQDAEKLRELDDHTTRAWIAYREQLQPLQGDEYEAAEDASWSELQQELRRLDRRRRTLIQTAR